MARWIRAAHLDECPPGALLEVVVGDRIVALANVEGHLFALDGICPHQGGSLGKGHLEGCFLKCPWHGWRFNVRNGKHESTSSVVQDRFPLTVKEGTILIDLESLL